MNKLLITAVLMTVSLASTGSAADNFSASQQKAWQSYCQSELDGQPAFCDCLLKAQVSEIGDKTVRLNLDSMVVDNPKASDADIDAANKAMESVSEKDFGDALMLFELSLDTAMQNCEA